MQNGLSDNWITGMAQDEKGFLWIGTENGLNRFDGSEFRKLQRLSDGRTHIDEIAKLLPDNNRLLLTTRKGIQALNVNNEQVTSYNLPDTEPGSVYENDALESVVTSEGDVLMSTVTGMYSFAKNSRLNFRYDKYKVGKGEQPGHSYGRGFIALPGNLYAHFTARDGLFIYDSRLKKYSAIDEYRNMFPNLAGCRLSKLPTSIGPYKYVLINNKLRTIFFYNAKTDHLQPCRVPDFFKPAIGWQTLWYGIDDSTAIVAGQSGGIYICNFNTNTGEVRVHPQQYFQDFFCTAILKDKEGRLWIGTNKGLLKEELIVKPVHTFNVKHFMPDYTKENYEITAFLRDGNELYLGTDGKKEIYVLDAATYSLKQKISFSTLAVECNQIWHILKMAKDTLWFATQKGLVWLCTQNKRFGWVTLPPELQPYLKEKPISIAFKDSHQLIWLQGSWGSGIIQYDPYTKFTRIFKSGDSAQLPVKSPGFITEDKEGNVWLAYLGVTRWNRQQQRFDTLIEKYPGFNGNNIHIVTLTAGLQSGIIFSNRHNGVLFYDPASEKYQHYTSAHGLPENLIRRLLAVNNGHLWMASRNYISALNTYTQKLITYSFADGIPAECDLPITLYHDAVARRVLIGYTGGFISWVADSIPPVNAGSIPFFIDAVSTAGQQNILYPGSKITLPYFDNDIRIHVAAINFNDVPNNQFWYRTSTNAPWIFLEKQNTINFNNLSPGRYSVEIKATSASNRWQPVTQQILIIIQPPFWKTGWFYGCILLLIGAIAFIIVRWRIETIRRTAELNNNLAITEMKALHAQMNPHFIFNSLNSIRELILQTENDKASHYLARFARLIRMNLHHSRQNFITLEQNIQYLYRYLEMEKLRFDDLEYAVSIDKQLDVMQVEIPPMLLQPLIENAIWHGLMPKKGNKKLDIRFLMQQNMLVCEVEDNGVGFNRNVQQKSGNHQSVGIENIRERIRLLNLKYAIGCRLDIEDLSTMRGDAATGTLARLTLSLIYE